ncbi:hypothetical protein DE146DRAFT_345234 [Phaeosphaeria sp. MPI-PUGE-AT-0046c]|nr:hypothetical protein DE146DRAFT_345234 [Phaeosphaeria sp. MPI-PUGE-AT-0046c]
MDYPAFNGGQPQPSFGFQSSAHSPQPTLPPQQAAFQQQPGHAFPYHGQQFPNNGQAFAASAAGMGGALQMQQQQQQQQQPMPPAAAGGIQRAPAAMHQPSYSAAPFSQAMPSPAHQHFAHNRQTASPATNPGQPYAAPHMPQHQPSLANGHHQTPPNHTPANHTPTNHTSMNHTKPEPAQAQTPVRAVPPSPTSPVAQARNQDRVATLLEINSLLIKEVCGLQSQGKAGQVGQTADGKPEGDKQQPSKEYVDYMRRLQANLAYLAQNAENKHKPGQAIQPGPAIMSVPVAPPELSKLYQKLVELFPGWKGQTAQMKQSPGPQRMNSTASTGSQPPNSAGLQPNWSQNAMANMQQAQAQAKIEP